MAQETEAEAALDYADWEKTADRAETELERRGITDERLEELRAQLTGWRAALLTAQNANSARIATVKEQIAALGPAPAEGETEAEEISARRKDLADRLVKLQAPGIAAEEAYRRADGLIREIDRILRERQADELLRVWPAPVNPANWPEAAVGISDTLLRFWDELAEGWTTPRTRDQFLANLPMIVLLLAVWVGLTIYARPGSNGWSTGCRPPAPRRGGIFWGFWPRWGRWWCRRWGWWRCRSRWCKAGFWAMSPPRSRWRALPGAGGVPGGLAGRAGLPQGAVRPCRAAPAARTPGRGAVPVGSMMGLVLAAEGLRDVSMTPQAYSEAVTSVATFPILLAGALLLWRMGRVMRQSSRDGEAQNYLMTLLKLVARALAVIGIAGPLAAAAGYVGAAKAMIYPAILSLGLLTLLLVMQRALADIWAVISPAPDEADREGLVPVLLGFALTVLSLPVFALIWGARFSDLTELWTRFREGFLWAKPASRPRISCSSRWSSPSATW
jgi:potassium efflux system protein